MESDVEQHITPKTLIEYLFLRDNSPEKLKMLAHMAKCPLCAEVFIRLIVMPV